MDSHQKGTFESIAREGVSFDYPMHRLTTYKVGGPVEVLWDASDLTLLGKGMLYLSAEGIPYGVFGNGSNLLVTDGGIDGVMIRLRGLLAEIRKSTDDARDAFTLWAGGGVQLADLMNFCRRNGMSGLEFLAGIPGTVGGAVAMNAGAFGHEIKERTISVQLMTTRGEQMEMHRSEVAFSYRSFHMEKGTVITGACFGLNVSTGKAVSEIMSGFLKIRKETQPQGFPSAGSVFKNPPGDYAGRLIEEAGLKGKRIGGAMVSEKHANYILNTGNATAKDILSLMDLIREAVLKTSGISLEPEIRILGKRV